MSSIGDMRARNGMNYREWLLGQALSGLSSLDHATTEEVVSKAFRAVDQIINRLAEESESEETPDQLQSGNGRKPLLLAEDGLPVYLVLNKDGHLDSLSALPTAMRLVAEKHGGTAVPVFVDGGISFLGGETLGVDYEWGIVNTVSGWWSTLCGRMWTARTDEPLMRFSTKDAASAHIKTCSMKNAVPFPIPEQKGGAL